MILHIKHAKYIEDYKIDVTFSDGRRGVADLSDALRGPIFSSLKDKMLFSQMIVDKTLATIAWPNGADFAPEFIYFKAFKDDGSLQDKFRKWGYIA